jgi:hypothetical protein
MHDVSLHDSQVREYTRLCMRAKIRCALQKISANTAGMRYGNASGRPTVCRPGQSKHLAPFHAYVH